MSFVLINHGWTNTRQIGHWQRSLAHQLRLQGHHVAYPQYPETETPNFGAWSELLIAELELLVELREVAQPENSNDQELIVIAHSLGCINLLKTALEGRIPANFKIDRLLLVAPPSPSLLDPVASFKIELNDKNLISSLNQVARNVTIVASDADPWIPEGIQASFGKALALEPIIIEGAKHLSSADGWASWAGVGEWVNDPQADLTKR